MTAILPADRAPAVPMTDVWPSAEWQEPLRLVVGPSASVAAVALADGAASARLAGHPPAGH